MSKIIILREQHGVEALQKRASSFADTHEVKAAYASGSAHCLVLQEKVIAPNNKGRSTRSTAKAAAKPAKQVRTVRSKSGSEGGSGGEGEEEVPRLS